MDNTRVWHSAARTPKTTNNAITSGYPSSWHSIYPCDRPRSRPVDLGRSQHLLDDRMVQPCSAGARGFFVRLAACHVSFTVWCRCRTTQHVATPQQRTRRQGGGLRDNVQHRRAVCATDRDDAKRTSRYPRAMRRARVESDNIFAVAWQNCSTPCRCYERVWMAQTHVGRR